MAMKYIVSAYGKDRPGIVADVTQVLYENGCNLEDTRMTNLSGEFSLMVLISCPGGQDISPTLSTAFSKLKEDKGITAYLRPVQSQEPTTMTPVIRHTLHVEGLDQTGIVYRISRFLADRAINIADLTSTITHAPESGAPIYTMQLLIETGKDTDMVEFESNIGRLAEELHVDIAID